MTACRAAFIAAAVVCGGTQVHAQSAPVRIDTPVALKQIITRVEPVWPEGAVSANPGAVMAADVLVSPSGTVESVNVITGPEALRPALIAALKKWTFKPFLSGGRPFRIVTMVDFEIQNPAKEREDKAIDDFFAVERECRRSVQLRLSDAVVTCERAATLSRNLPQDRALERSGASGLFGGSLLVAGRPAEALVQFEAAIAHRRERVRDADSDADTADLYGLAGQALWCLGSFPKADIAFVTATEIYKRAMLNVPSLQANYRQRLDTVLRERARLLGEMGKPAEAAAVERGANDLDAPARRRAMPSMTRAGNLLLGGSIGPLLTTDDVRQIRALLPTGEIPWLLIGSGQGDSDWYVDVFLQAERTMSAYRRGPVVGFKGSGAAGGSKKWVKQTVPARYVQVPLPGRDANEVLRSADQNQPVKVMETSDPITDDEAADLIAFLRSTAKAPGDPFKDVQPWPIDSLVRWNNSTVQARLHQGVMIDGPRQTVTLRRKGNTWVIVELDAR